LPARGGARRDGVNGTLAMAGTGLVNFPVGNNVINVEGSGRELHRAALPYDLEAVTRPSDRTHLAALNEPAGLRTDALKGVSAMGAHTLTTRVAKAQVSTVRRGGDAVGVGIVFRNRLNETVRKIGYVSRADDLEQVTYRAVITALEEAARLGAPGLTVQLDSPQVVEQLGRRTKVPPALLALHMQARCRANALRRVRFELAPRGDSFAARRLARAASLEAEPVNVEYDTPLLPLTFGEGRYVA
jgi:ribonuclease HI